MVAQEIFYKFLAKGIELCIKENGKLVCNGLLEPDDIDLIKKNKGLLLAYLIQKQNKQGDITIEKQSTPSYQSGWEKVFPADNDSDQTVYWRKDGIQTPAQPPKPSLEPESEESMALKEALKYKITEAFQKDKDGNKFFIRVIKDDPPAKWGLQGKPISEPALCDKDPLCVGDTVTNEGEPYKIVRFTMEEEKGEPEEIQILDMPFPDLSHVAPRYNFYYWVQLMEEKQNEHPPF